MLALRGVLALLGNHEVVVVLPDDLRSGPSEQPLGFAVRLEDVVVEAEDEDRIVGLFHEGPVAAFRSGEALERLAESHRLAELQGEVAGEAYPGAVREVVAVGGQHELTEGLAEDDEWQDESGGMAQPGQEIPRLTV